MFYVIIIYIRYPGNPLNICKYISFTNLYTDHASIDIYKDNGSSYNNMMVVIMVIILYISIVTTTILI